MALSNLFVLNTIDKDFEKVRKHIKVFLSSDETCARNDKRTYFKVRNFS